jgi:hypothetical protein
MTQSTIESRRGPRGFALRAQRERVIGAVVGFVIAGIMTVLGANWDQAPFLTAGIPAATAAGYLAGPAIRADRAIVRGAIAMSVVTLLLADALVVLRWAPEGFGSINSLASVTVAVAELIGLWLIGLILVGIPMYVLLVGPCGLAWAAIVYRITVRRKVPSA